MKNSHVSLLVMLFGSCILQSGLAQSWDAEAAYWPSVRLGLSQQRSHTQMPDDYVDYSFTWNGNSQMWDSADIATTRFWGTPDAINVSTHIQEREGTTLVEGGWIDTYNMNFEEVDFLDPATEFTYVPADSLHAVVDAPYFGKFPLSSYYDRTDDDQLHRESDFFNGTLMGDPNGLILPLGESISHYDANGQLLGARMINEGLDSTECYFNALGQMVQSINMISYYSNDPEEFIIEDYAYDDASRLISIVTAYYTGSLDAAPDFKDSLTYIYGNGDNYQRESYFYNENTGAYQLGGMVSYSYEGDSLEIVDIYNIFNGEPRVTQRSRNSFDSRGRLKQSLVLRSFLGDELENSERIIRVYESTVANFNPQRSDAEWMTAHFDGSNVQVTLDRVTDGQLMLFGVSGRLLDHGQINGRNGKLLTINPPAGIYYVVLSDIQGHFLGSARVMIP